MQTDELDGQKLEIHVSANGSALLRHQMLYEDFSHIYDSKFARLHSRSITLIQKWFRKYKWRQYFTQKLAEKRQKEEEDPPKYFTRVENEETMNKDKILDYWKVD